MNEMKSRIQIKGKFCTLNTSEIGLYITSFSKCSFVHDQKWTKIYSENYFIKFDFDNILYSRNFFQVFIHLSCFHSDSNRQMFMQLRHWKKLEMRFINVYMSNIKLYYTEMHPDLNKLGIEKKHNILHSNINTDIYNLNTLFISGIYAF